jgi:hypothetical protein
MTDEIEQPGTFGHHWGIAGDVAVPDVLPAIQDLVWRYAFALDSKNVALVAGLFSARSRFGRWGDGPDGAAAYYENVWQRFGASIHSITNILLTPVDRAHLRGIVYCRSERDFPSTGWELQQMVYFDDYVLEGDAWRFFTRTPRFWYRDSAGVRHDSTEIEGENPKAGPQLPQAWNTWGEFWERAGGE